MHRPAIASILVLVSLAVAAPAIAAPQAPGRASATSTVKLIDSVMAPSSLTVRRGARVRFVWAGSIAHNLSGPGVPRSYLTARVRARTLTLTLRRKGSLRFLCTLHPGMALRVRVR
ncbi:unannotated protein [freshwater metagenome]|uniref:Unannotated protein n=1 Tax=freshwater metagenome TaxID=449393 RepID=A0A6J7DL74_9ZZZZ|nr:hypothetical protein [Actinomycetota bacterium]